MDMILKTEKVIKEWTDYNGHLNVAFYVRIFDIASALMLDNFNMGGISAKKDIGIQELVDVIKVHFKKNIHRQWIKMDSSLGNIKSKLYSEGRVIEERTSDIGLIQLLLEIEEVELGKLLSFRGIELDNTLRKGKN